VKRNAARFPADFMFQLDAAEKAEVVTNCDHLHKLKYSKALPFAFTEYGAVALANVLASSQAQSPGLCKGLGALTACAQFVKYLHALCNLL
jgi:hypothetical protein